MPVSVPVSVFVSENDQSSKLRFHHEPLMLR
jgi:hypothetical protein